MRFFNEKAQGSPTSSLDHANDRDYPHTGEYDDDLHVECPPHTTERKLVRKIDIHVIPCLCIMYLLAFLDRVNIANANVYGLAKQLHLTGNQYNVALVIFFVPYVLFEIPSNLLLKRFKPHVWLSLNMFLFGFTTIMEGVVKNYSGLLAVRFFLGVFETGMIFILEGCLTVAFSFVVFFALPDFPEESKWLTSEEKSYVSARLRVDQGRSALERRITAKDVGRVLMDYKVVAAGFMYFGLIVPAYGYAYFAPGIIKTYGYSAIQTQLHSVPPWAAAFGFAMLTATLSDITRKRAPFAIGCICVAIAGFAILITVHNNGPLQYAALFLVAMGAYSAMPIIVCWFGLNLGGHHRRSVGTAWQIGFGNIGGIIAVWAFLAKDAPKYITGYSICLAFTVLSIIACIVYGVGCWAANRRRDRTPVDIGLTEYEKTEMVSFLPDLDNSKVRRVPADLAQGDMNPEYRYML
ncbi:High-affinity nicotinic acid transporter [Friedmanniomyces endolithicus]|nr:High-affinity nicotinic acid transporter [Friedmanniomyces endolithicus]